MAGILDDRPNMPGFNMLGLLLGGRGYAANYFGMRDQAAMQENERQQRERFAQGLLASPQLAAANANPLDRNAQFGLWGQFYGQPGGNVQLGNSLLDTSIRSIYGREASVFDQAQYEKRLNLSAESELKVDQIKRDRDVAAKKAALSTLFAPGESGQPGIIEQANRNAAFDTAYPGQRNNRDVVPTAGGLAYRPSPGSEDYRKMFGEIQSGQNMMSGLTNLNDMLNNGTGSKGDWEAEKTAMLFEVKKLEELGALDQGAVDTVDKLVPGWNDNWSANPQNWGAQKEKLRVALQRYGVKLAQAQDRWAVPVDFVPNRAASVQAPGTPTKPMPSGPASATRDALQRKVDSTPPQQSRRTGNVWDTPAGGRGY